MAIRRIIKINEADCNGCGICAAACHEQAIVIKNGKAQLIKDEYCDGLGDCLPECPKQAISFEEREAADYNEPLVKARLAAGKAAAGSGCLGSKAINLKQSKTNAADDKNTDKLSINSELLQWPLQIKLVPVQASYFADAKLLVAADCTAFAYGDFHRKFIKNHITLIGCPKLDEGDYSEKLTEIISNNNIKSVTVVRMEVPCCGGIENAVKAALQNSGKMIPWQVVTVATNGELCE